MDFFDIIVNFIIQKLKNKYIYLKKYTHWAILGHVTQNLEFTSCTPSCEPMPPYTGLLVITP